MSFFNSLKNAFRSHEPKKNSPHHHLHQLEADWDYIHKAFFSENAGAHSLDVSQTEIPKRLGRMVKILSDEQATKGEKEINICMEHFLKNNIMGGLYDISQLNFPSGLFLEITKTFSQLVTELSRKFLVHSSVHLPILKLLKTAMYSTELSANTEREVVQLMFAVSCRLIEYPDLLSVLFHEKKFSSLYRQRTSSTSSTRASEFQVAENSDYDYPLFLYLLHFVHYEGTTGDYARTALLFCLQTATPLVDEFILRYSGFSHIMVTALSGRFASLSAQYVGSDAEESLSKFVISLEFYQKAVVEASPAVAMDLVDNFKRYFLVKAVLPKLAADNTVHAEIAATTRYVDRMLMLITEENLAHDFVSLLVDENFAAGSADESGSLAVSTSNLAPSTPQRQPVLDAASAAATATGNGEDHAPPLSALQSPAFSFGSGLTQPLSDLVNASSSANLLAPPKPRLLRSMKHVLLLRLNDPADDVQVATWELFHTIVSQHRGVSVPKLLHNTFHLLSTMDPSDKSEWTHADEIRRYLELFPTPQQVTDYEVMGYEYYLADVQEIVTSQGIRGTRRAAPVDKKAKKVSGALPSPMKPGQVEPRGRGESPSAAAAASPLKTPLEGNGASGDAGATGGPLSHSSSFSDPLSEQLLEAAPTHHLEPDTFVDVLLGRLESFTSNTFECNLMLTGIFTQLACYPDARLSEFILHSDLLHHRYLLSLHAILSRVQQEMVRSLLGIAHSAEHLETLRNALDVTAIPHHTKKSASVMDKEEEFVLRNVVVFEEFIKELGATLQVQLITGQTQINYMD